MSEFTSRYEAAGIAYPDPATVCQGQCDGMGCYPQFCFDGQDHLIRTRKAYPCDAPNEYELHAWRAVHAKAHTIRTRVWNAIRFRRASYLWEKCDGWHFIKCADCNGTGKRSPTTEDRA